VRSRSSACCTNGWNRAITSTNCQPKAMSERQSRWQKCCLRGFLTHTWKELPISCVQYRERSVQGRSLMNMQWSADVLRAAG
jgi:hypothetical protein